MVVNNMAAVYKGMRWINYPIDRLVVKSVDKFVTGSISASERLKVVLKLSKDQLQPIHNGIKLRETTSDSGKILKRFGLESFDGIIFGVIALLEHVKVIKFF